MASLDISWTSGSLDTIHAGPEPSADVPVAPSRRPSPCHADDGSVASTSEACSVLDASEGMCLRPARGSGKQTLDSFSISQLSKLFTCSRSSTLPSVKLSVLWNRTPREWRRIYLNKSKANFLVANWARGRQIKYDAPTFSTLSFFISRFLFQGVVCKVPRERNFVSYPFLIPKKPGERPSFIADFGHLRSKNLYSAPKFRLVPVIASAAASATLKEAKAFAKMNLIEAFHSMPLPRSLWRVSTFKFGGQFYQFRRLPMGLYVTLSFANGCPSALGDSVAGLGKYRRYLDLGSLSASGSRQSCEDHPATQ